MKCEICKTIEKLGLDPAAHDLWVCSNEVTHRIAMQSVKAYVEQLKRQADAFWILKKRQRRAWMMAHQQHFVTLGL
jgi:hypothetical protein